MKSLHALATALSCALLVAALSPAARADDWNNRTFITFSDSVEVPGAVLQPGKYVFKLMDSPADRHIVQISNERGNHVFATVLAIPSFREIPPDKTLVTFYEVPAGNPAPIKLWFYPGDQYGQEFVYSSKRHAEILAMGRQLNERVETASTTTEPQPVVAATTPPATGTEETTPAPDNSSAESSAPAPSTTAVEATNEESPAPPPEETAEPQPKQPATSTPPDNTELPHTASSMPLVGLIGLLSLLSAVGLRTMRKSS